MKIETFIIGAFLLTTTAITLYSLNTQSPPDLKLQSFLNFKKKFKKLHNSPTEMEYRYSIYKSNLSYINLTNAQNLPYKLGENQFSDLTFSEFSKAYLLTPLKNKITPGPLPTFKTEVDWRTKRVLTPIKDQKACGSCWAFSTTGSMEAILAINSSSAPVSLSEQELVDCSTSYGNYGCNGGLPSYAFNYIEDHKIGTEADYGYVGRNGTCKRNEGGERFTVSSWKSLDSYTVEALAEAVVRQPVSVAIEVQRSFQMYKSGVYVGKRGCGRGLNHAVLLVGLVDEGNGNWDFIVKNSWGTVWGEEGFIKMRTGSGTGNCGIANSWDAIPSA